MSFTVPLPQLDIASFTQPVSQIQLNDVTNHVIDLDPVDISNTLFQKIFYPSSTTFQILSPTNPNSPFYTDPSLISLISFNSGTVGGASFCLLDQLYNSIETDLQIGKSSISPNSILALNKQISQINTLYDLQNPSSNSVAPSTILSLSWQDILSIVTTSNPKGSIANITMVITVVFASTTTGVSSTIVKFYYNTTVSV